MRSCSLLWCVGSLAVSLCAQETPGSGQPRQRVKGAPAAVGEGLLQLAWDPRFLPYDGAEKRETGVWDAVRGGGGSSAWPVSERPCFVVVYDSKDPAHREVLLTWERDRRFQAAAAFFDLVRIERASIQDAANRPAAPAPAIMVFSRRGEPGPQVQKLDPGTVVAAMVPVVEKSYGRLGEKAVATMEGLQRRQEALNEQIKLQEAHLTDPRSGRVAPAAAERTRRLKRELWNLRGEMASLLVPAATPRSGQ